MRGPGLDGTHRHVDGAGHVQVDRGKDLGDVGLLFLRQAAQELLLLPLQICEDDKPSTSIGQRSGRSVQGGCCCALLRSIQNGSPFASRVTSTAGAGAELSVPGLFVYKAAHVVGGKKRAGEAKGAPSDCLTE